MMIIKIRKIYGLKIVGKKVKQIKKGKWKKYDCNSYLREKKFSLVHFSSDLFGMEIWKLNHYQLQQSLSLLSLS